MTSAIEFAERGVIPEPLIRFGIRRLVKQRLEDEFAYDPDRQSKRYRALLEELRSSEIAIETDAANEQHYEVPAEYFHLALGKYRKYSACLWEPGTTTLEEAELAMLQSYASKAQMTGRQKILELGCGWGSFTLWAAETFPESQFTAVSNSNSQRKYIEAEASSRGLSNIRIITQDVNLLELDEQFDRIISIEMFEHMRNYRKLLQKISGWLKDDGKLFVHIFCHRYLMYPFETEGDDNWMGKYFFTGGIMPATQTLLHFQEHLTIADQWTVSGSHYQKTADAWLANHNRNRAAIEGIFALTYGESNASVWFHRWAIFYLACSELFGYNNGAEWPVAHYLFEKRIGIVN